VPCASGSEVTFTYGSLFSGIGGIDLGLDRAGMTPLWQSEINPFASRVLEKNWPGVPNLGDIKSIDWKSVEEPDLICGGYPCPAFSFAAAGLNNAPDLWPYMRDAIAAIQPQYVLIENVAAHLKRGFPDVLRDLDGLGYDTEWSIISACALGASHMRRRLFAIAYPHGHGKPIGPFDEEARFLSEVAGDSGHWGQASADDVRADDGVPDRLDRVKALGNAVVPHVAEFIGRRIMHHHANVVMG
jgi:DNA (cytosine-5)-methyltransferase 1